MKKLIVAALAAFALAAAPIAAAQEGQPGLPGCAGPCGPNIGLPGTNLQAGPVPVFQLPTVAAVAPRVPVFSLGVFGSSSQNPTGSPGFGPGVGSVPTSAVGGAGAAGG